MGYSVKTQSINLKKHFWIIASIWSSFVLIILIWNLFHHNKQVYDVALVQAQNVFQKDLVYRRRATGHGGVYVPVTKETPSNLYLFEIKELDIEQYGLKGRNISFVPL